MRHIISVLLANEAGALGRVSGLFSSRGYNIESLTVAPTQDCSVSRLTLVTTGSDKVIEQINKQLRKLVEVIDVADMTQGAHIERELLLIKLGVDRDDIERLTALAKRQNARILDDTPASFTLEFSGTGSQVDAFIADVTDGPRLLELVRTGAGAIGCGEHSLNFHG